MTEQTQEDAKKFNRGSAKQQDRSYHSDVENVEERKKFDKMVSECLRADDSDQQQDSGRRKPALVRSKTFDHSLLTQVQTDSTPKIDRKKSQYSQLSKSNCQYHKIFKEISKEEQLRQSYTCALQKDILYQGRMFVSDHWICFHSKVFGKDTKIAIPVMSVSSIRKTKTAILVPNALVIATANDKEKSPWSSPIPSSAESSFRGQRSPLLPRFPLDFGDLDGAVRQRRQEMEESSSSDSQTPDDEKIPEFPVPPFLDVLKQTVPPEHPSDLQNKVKNQHQNQQNSENKLHNAHRTGSELAIDSRLVKPVSLNTVMFVYLFLVCVLVLSSCFLALKIVSLEQRLSTFGSVADFTQTEFLRGGDSNAELFSELLTINLMKLEKVQKNLQRLLDEAA